MDRQRILPIAACALTAACCLVAPAQPQRAPLIRQADRVLIESNDPGALVAFCRDTLQLPVDRPVAEQETYTSGSVSAGDVILEFYRYGDRKRRPAPARFASLSLEPGLLANALADLRAAGFPHDPPEIHLAALPDGSEGPVWMRVRLPALSHEAFVVTLFEYSPEFLNMEVRRKQFGNRLALDGGGPLGILATYALVLESDDVDAARRAWARLLGPPGPDGYMRAERGPAFRIVRGPANGIQKTIFRVRSLARAESFLDSRGLLGAKGEKEIFLRASAVEGLRISLAETLPD